MNAITIPTGYPYAIRLPVPIEMEPHFLKAQELSFQMTSATQTYRQYQAQDEKFSERVQEAGHRVVSLTSDYHDAMKPCSSWASDRLYDELGIPKSEFMDLWVVPEEYAEEMLYGFTSETPVYNLLTISTEMSSVPYDGTVQMLKEVLATFPPIWKLGRDLIVKNQEVLPLPIQY